MKNKKITIEKFMELSKRPKPVWLLVDPIGIGRMGFNHVSKMLELKLIKLPSNEEIEAYNQYCEEIEP